VAPGEVTARRSGDRVVVRFAIPRANQSGLRPADIELVEVYAWTPPPPAPAAPPTAAEASLPDPLPSRPYSAWPTVAPSFWLPLIAASSSTGWTFGAFTAGTDVLMRHLWTLQGWWREDLQEPGYALFYQGGWSWPFLDLSSRLDVESSPGLPNRLQRVWNYADVGATFTFTQLARSLSLRVGWSGTGYQSIEPQAPLPPQLEPYRFRDGFLSEALLQARYSDARRFVRSISPEEGRTIGLSLGIAAPELGSDYALARAQASATQYLRVPPSRHVVLALRAAGGLADGTIGGRAPFTLGGISTPDPTTLLTGSLAIARSQLRGYPSGAFGGTGYVSGNVELRFPLAEPGRGHSTWPIFLQRIHGAAFLDAGDG
jgi:hypothetical protein